MVFGYIESFAFVISMNLFTFMISLYIYYISSVSYSQLARVV